MSVRAALRGLIGSRLLQVLWAAAIVIVIVLFATLLPMAEQAPRFAHADKAFHAGYFLLLGALSVLAQGNHQAAQRAALGMVGLGVVIELIQWLLPWRSFELLDMLADAVGVAVGYLVAVRLRVHPAHR